MRPRERTVLALVVVALLESLIFYMHSARGHGDITLYHRYAEAFWLNVPPMTSLPAEYPILSVATFTLTILPPLPDFVSVFGLWMLVLFLALWAAIRQMESWKAAEIAVVYLAVGCFATVLGRFDLVPAAATVFAYWAARERHFGLAFALLAVGTLLKLYPMFLVPVVVLEQYRALGLHPLRSAPPRPVVKGVVLFCGMVVGMFGVSAILSPGGWLGPLTFNAQRPLQVESVPASVLWLSGLFGMATAPDRSFHSYNLIGQVDGILSVLSELALLGGCIWVYWGQMTDRLSLGRAVTACLLVVICTNKVFSPQYLIWVLPLIAMVDREYDGVWLAICALTTLIFPYAYEWAQLHGPDVPASYPFWFSGLIAIRNALLTVALARFVRRSRSRTEVFELEPTASTAA